MVMEGTLPECDFANFVLWNRYLQSFDYINGQSSLNRKQMALAGAGTNGGSAADPYAGKRYRIILSARKPAGLDEEKANWLSVHGRPRGTVFWRFVLPKEEIETPTVKIMPLDELEAEFR